MNATHPFREAPSPRIVAAVRRFGLPGLILCALCAGLSRGFNRLRTEDPR